MEYTKKLKEIEKIMDLIENNKDLDKQMELYEMGKKKCASLEKKIKLQKQKIEKINNDINSDDNTVNIDEDDKDINRILKEIEEIYVKINNEELPIEDIENFYKKSLLLKKKSQKFKNIQNLDIKYIS